MRLNIGQISLDNPVLLAPMSGITDLPFRRIARRYGAGLVVSEMIASRELLRDRRRSRKMIETAPDEAPVAVQLAGCEPEIMADAARLNQDLGAAIIDINFGCPVKKVVGGLAGSALMRDETHAVRILTAVIGAVSIPVTLKMRTGWDEHNRNAPRLARIAEDCGIRMITVHGRSRCQFYQGHADWSFLGEVKNAVTLPVIGNGDVAGPDDAAALIARSGVDGVMIGRAACGRPWLPGIIARYLATGARAQEPGLAERMAVVTEHFEGALRHYGVELGLRIMRKHIGWYIHGMTDPDGLRARLMRAGEPDQVREGLSRLFDWNLSHGAHVVADAV